MDYPFTDPQALLQQGHRPSKLLYSKSVILDLLGIGPRLWYRLLVIDARTPEYHATTRSSKETEYPATDVPTERKAARHTFSRRLLKESGFVGHRRQQNLVAAMWTPLAMLYFHVNILIYF